MLLTFSLLTAICTLIGAFMLFDKAKGDWAAEKSTWGEVCIMLVMVFCVAVAVACACDIIYWLHSIP